MERISLSNATFEGHNNTYLFADGPETVLIDTGDWLEPTREQLAASLAEHGVGIGDIDRVFLTHWHPDHTGLAGEIQAQSGADIHVHADDASLVEGDEDSWAELDARQARYFDTWGMPTSKQEVLREEMTDARAYRTPTVTPFTDGDVFSVNGHDLRVIHTSGHAAGLCMFEVGLDGRPVVFSGDALLPVYTPNVGGADVRVDNPLATYLRALRDIADAGYARAWPGHREPIDDPASRAEHIIHHHEERAWRVLRIVQQHGPIDTWSVSDALFGDLDGIHILHGPGEAFAHLTHLERTGAVLSEGAEYRVADGVGAELARIDDQRWRLGCDDEFSGA